MRDISRRIKNAEEKLNINEKEIVWVIPRYSGELPPPEKVAGMNIRFELYDDKVKNGQPEKTT